MPGETAKMFKEGFGSVQASMMPGQYDVYINYKLVAAVPVQSGKELSPRRSGITTLAAAIVGDGLFLFDLVP